MCVLNCMCCSTGAVELRNSLASKLDAELPATLTFDYPSISALATFLATQSSPKDGRHSDVEPQASREAASISTDAILAELQGIVSGMLGAEVAPDQPLMEAGLDSLGKQMPPALLLAHIAQSYEMPGLKRTCPLPFAHLSACRCCGAAQHHCRSLRS